MHSNTDEINKFDVFFFFLQVQSHFQMLALDVELVRCFLTGLVALEENKPCSAAITVE